MKSWTFNIVNKLKCYVEDLHGLAAVEFAFIAPIMAALMLGTYEISDALTAYRRVNNVASVIGDLTAQDTSINNAEMKDILDSGAIVMSPYDAAKLHMRIFSIEFDQNATPSVAWSDTRNWSASEAGCMGSIPPAVMQPNMSIICAEARYKYDSVLNYVIPGIKILDERSYHVPRRSLTVQRTP